MDQRLSLVTLGAKNLQQMRDFYETGLGWTALYAVGDIVFYQLPGFVVALYPYDKLAEDARLAPGAGFGGITLAYNAGNKNDVDRIMGEAEKAGAQILKPAQDTFWGGYSGYFSDPSGYAWEIAYGEFYTITEDGRTIFHFE